jgi:hypothetical protein
MLAQDLHLVKLNQVVQFRGGSFNGRDDINPARQKNQADEAGSDN